VREWLQRFSETLLLVRLEPWHRRPAARLRAQPKIYAADPGLVSAFSPAARLERARQFEAAAFRHLRAAARLRVDNLRPRRFEWETEDGHLVPVEGRWVHGWRYLR
jgi:predicted AAA+ superfamily ATPase